MTISKKRKEYLIGYSFILPNFIGYFFVTFIPVLCAFVLSLFKWNGSAASLKFLGLGNFIKMFNNSTFQIALNNTIYYALVAVPLTMVCSLGLAILLNQKIVGRNFCRSALFFPHVASVVAIAVVFNMLFNPDMGPINQLLAWIGINPEFLPRWSASVDWSMPTVILASVWKSMGYYMIVYLAALQNVPADLYEAASIDGATGWKKFRYITWPMLTPTTFFVVIMLTVSCFKVFDLIWLMTMGGPGRSSTVLAMHIYKSAFLEGKLGYASAVGVALFFIVMLITLVQFKLENKWASNF